MHTVTIQRSCSQRTNDKIIRRHVDFLIERALTGHRKTWEGTAGKTLVKQSQVVGFWDFTVTLKFERTARKTAHEVKQWADILERLATAGQHTKFNKYPWQVLTDGKATKGSPAPVVVKPIIKDAKDYYDKINTDPGTLFDKFYNREPQIKRALSAIQAAKDSGFNNRFNVVFHGPPGCGKTDLMRTFGRMLGEENEAYTHMDATSMTAAGVAKMLLENDYIPPVLFVEEIEKSDENSLKWLLGVADIRGEIRRTNFRIGNAARNVKMLVVASVNNMKLFRSVMSGALASRFPIDIYCPRPDRETLRRILEREVKKNNGKMEWIEPTLVYCFDQKKWNDPRKLLPVCLCGKDDLLDGSYQKAMEDTATPVEDE
jgi:chromosomal replication initiation ATPase DnaA